MNMFYDRWLNSVLKKRKETTRALEFRGQTRGPGITYHDKGKSGLRFVRDYLNGPEIRDKIICLKNYRSSPYRSMAETLVGKEL